MKHMGSKSGNLTQYQWKRLQHRFMGFLKKSQNQVYVYEKCIWMGTFLAGKSFDIVVWKNKVDGTQNFDISWKSALEVAKPTIENRKYHENPIDSKIWSRYPDKTRTSAKIIWNIQTLRFQQYHMYIWPSGTQKFTLNIGHNVIFDVN